MDLEKDWPFKDSSTDRILAHHVLEHVERPLHFLSEASRVLKKGGEIEVIVPYYLSVMAYALDHKHYFCERAFEDYFSGGERNYGIPLKLVSLDLQYPREAYKLIGRILGRNAYHFLPNTVSSFRAVLRRVSRG